MDLSQINPVDAVRVEIRHPATDEPIGLALHLRHRTSAPVQAVNTAFQREVAKLRLRQAPPEMLQRFVTDQIVAAVARWEWTGDANLRGEKPELTEGKLREVLAVDWIRDQAAAGFVDEASFFRRDQ